MPGGNHAHHLKNRPTGERGHPCQFGSMGCGFTG